MTVLLGIWWLTSSRNISAGHIKLKKSKYAKSGERTWNNIYWNYLSGKNFVYLFFTTIDNVGIMEQNISFSPLGSAILHRIHQFKSTWVILKQLDLLWISSWWYSLCCPNIRWPFDDENDYCLLWHDAISIIYQLVCNFAIVGLFQFNSAWAYRRGTWVANPGPLQFPIHLAG